MKKSIGAVLMLVGGLAIVAGLFMALQAFASMYSSNLADPLNVPDNSERQVSQSMMRGVYVGAPGAVLFVIGRILLMRSRRRVERDASSFPR